MLTLLDFSNAFNAVDFDVLCGILCSLNISPEVIEWFRSYLQGRQQRICVEDKVSMWCNTTAGVPQGGVLSPLLFSVFINTITHSLSSSYHLYADDLQIYTQATYEDITLAISTINKDLATIVEWSRDHGLNVNPSKTKVILIGSYKFIDKVDYNQLNPVVFDGVLLPYNRVVKNLGVFLDSTLSWKPQLEFISKKVFSAAGSLRRLRNFLPIPTRIALAQSLILPILDYADISYLDLTEEQLNKLERLQNLCIRFIFGLRKYDHISEFRNKLKWLPIRLRRNTHTLSFLYGILFNPCLPFYLKERFKFRHQHHERNLRSASNLLLATPRHCSHFYQQSFTVKAISLWNSLPSHLRSVKSLDSFKRQVKNFYLLH